VGPIGGGREPRRPPSGVDDEGSRDLPCHLIFDLVSIVPFLPGGAWLGWMLWGAPIG
jgi:hypothetical protein